MLRFIVVSVLFAVAASEINIFGNVWYPLRLYTDLEVTPGSCDSFRFKKTEKTCTCNKQIVPTGTVQAEGKDESPSIPIILLGQDEAAASALAIKCTCPDMETPRMHFVYKRITDNNFLTYITVPSKGYNVVFFGNEKISKESLNELVRNVDVEKNWVHTVDVCTTDNNNTTDKKKTWASFVPKA